MKFTSLTIILGFFALVVMVPAFAADEEWSDYDPCGWNATQTVTDVQPYTPTSDVQAYTPAASDDDEWSDNDPCGWNAMPTERL